MTLPAVGEVRRSHWKRGQSPRIAERAAAPAASRRICTHSLSYELAVRGEFIVGIAAFDLATWPDRVKRAHDIARPEPRR